MSSSGQPGPFAVCGAALLAACLAIANLGAQAPAEPAADASNAGAAQLPVRTKLAVFAPTKFSDLPGWREDDFREAALAFRETCNALGRRPAWTAPCARFAAIDSRRSEDFRRFLEAEFVLYQIHNHDESPTGVITGYYEPLLTGSRQPDSRYAYPVYGVPDDLLFLDARDAAAAAAGTTFLVRGRNAVVNEPGRAATGEASFTLQIGSINPDRRDRKVRVRIDGSRLVPYHTRAQIDTQGLRNATVIVWVDDPAALYSMHVQGAGKIRLPDGEIVRLAFAEQNGHPFLPPVSARASAANAPAGLRTRGIDLQAAIEAQESPADGVLTRGIASGGTGAAPAKAATDTAAVEAMVELLLAGGAGAQKAAPAKASPAAVAIAPAAAKAPVPAVKASPPNLPEIKPATVSPATPEPIAAPAPEIKPAIASRPEPPLPAPEVKTAAASRPPPDPSPPPVVAATNNPAPGRQQFSGDPSFVFFRQIRDYEGGPIGALGVPLTPQRSIAVDPRTTPLGMPVYLVAADGGEGGGLRRLMVAQDTGGAIRGAVRADFFWGFGPQAGQRASQTKLLARMWVLMPKALTLAALPGAITTRSVGRGIIDIDAECVVADADLCVE